jgi:hypothetical protein
MPVSLRVKISGPINLSSLLPKVSATLAEILGLPYAPEIVAEEYVGGQLKRVGSETISCKDGGTVFLRIPEGADNASLFCYERQIEHETGEESLPLAVIEVGSGRTPVDFAIAAAVAAALARENNTDVVDDMPFFTEEFEQPADRFIEGVRVKGLFNDYRTAAEAFFEACYAERRSATRHRD